jgi:hypothetical protein
VTRPYSWTRYEVVDGQVVVPATAAERRGIQPVVTVTANCKERADVVPSQQVEFLGVIEVPPGAGFVVAAEWDFEGAGDYPLSSSFDGAESCRRVTVKTSYAFSQPGTYFPALRAARIARAIRRRRMRACKTSVGCASSSHR